MRAMRPSTLLLACAISGLVASAALAQARQLHQRRGDRGQARCS